MESIAVLLIKYAPLVEQAIVTVESLVAMKRAGISDDQIQRFLNESLPQLRRRNAALGELELPTNFPGE